MSYIFQKNKLVQLKWHTSEITICFKNITKHEKIIPLNSPYLYTDAIMSSKQTIFFLKNWMFFLTS